MVQGPVKGHDFSRAATNPNKEWALAPEGRVFDTMRLPLTFFPIHPGRQQSIALVLVVRVERRQIDRHKGETGLVVLGRLKTHNVLVALGAGLQLETIFI